MKSKYRNAFLLKTNILCEYSLNNFGNVPFTMKIDTPEFRGIFSPGLQTLLDIFERHKYEIRVAGGAVRDILLGKHPKDVDFATTATPDQMKEMFTEEDVRMINMKGEKHGTITARIDNENFEVTTLRIDVTTDGRHAEVMFTTDWELDANRRDLTINSMFLGVDGTLYDYFGGYEDLKNRRVLFVGNAKKRIQEDYLRILRYFRFFGRITEKPEFHDDDTIVAIKDNVEGLGRISGERIWQELSKISSGNYVGIIIQKIIEVGAAPYIGLPKDPNINELKCVWERGKNLNMHPLTVLVSLLNSEQEMMTFHARCKFSTFERELGLFIVEHRNTDCKSDNPLRPYQILIFKIDGKLSDTRAHIIELLKYKADLALLHQFKTWEPPKFPLNGNLLKEHGVPVGKPIGRVMKELKLHWIETDFKMNQDELIELLPKVMEELNIKTQAMN